MTAADSANLERRIRALENANRRWRFAALATLVLLPVAWTVHRQPVDRIEAQAFALVDARGEALAALTMTDGGPSLLLYDDTGVVRASLSHNDDETALYLRDAAGDNRVGVAQFAHGGGGFALHGPEVKGAAVLYYKDGGSLTFYDIDGQILHRFP